MSEFNPLSDLRVEPARSSRPCRSCKGSIARGDLRIGIQIDRDEYTKTRWYHSSCYFGNTFNKQNCKNNRRKGDKKVTMNNIVDIMGYDDLSSKQQASFKANLKKEKIIAGASEELPSTPLNRKKRKRLEQEGESNDKQEGRKRGKPSKETRRSLKEKLLRLGLPTTGNKKDLMERLYAAESTKKKRSKKKRKTMVSDQKAHAEELDMTDIERARELAEELKSKTKKTLSQMLRDNFQAVSGSKTELIARVTDRILFGCIPECPKCGCTVGLKVTYKETNHKGQGKWLHRGSYDDEGVFQVCGFKATNVERYPWTDTK